MRNFLIHACCAWLLVGCARDINSGLYTSDSVDRTGTVYEGSVVSMREVTIKEGEKLSDNTAGMLIGGILGGATGSAIGGGRARAITTVLGAAAGAGAGAYAQEKMSTQKAIEYVVKLKNGGMRTIVQGKDSIYSVGQRVMISMGNGRPRIVHGY